MTDIDIVRSLPRRLRLGAPISSGPLELVPLFGGIVAPTYSLAAEAIAHGALAITEVGEGQVPTLGVANSGDVPVLLVEGEHLQGARQDRVLNVTVLVPPKAELAIPVSCVEHGRWAYRTEQRFAPAPEFAHTRLRAAKTATVAARRRLVGDRMADQGAIWAEVERKRAEVGAGVSSTAAMRDTFVQRGVDVDRILAAFERPSPKQTGVVVCVSGEPVALDAFDRPETLAALWPRLVRGYAMEALGSPARSVERAETASAFVERVTSGEGSEYDAVGLGREVAITSPGSIASALVWKGAVVHLAAFADATSTSERGRSSRRMNTRRTWFHERSGPDGR
jgi:ARG and Rhodanese-Phosphatase-superfamily-associated Protein domain